MEYIAIAKNIKISPRKARLVAEGVKKNNLKSAVASLTVMNKRAAGPIKKAIDSAISNAVNNFKAQKESLTIKDIIVTEGMRMKRYHFAARGRVRPYKKRTSHIRVVLSDGLVKSASQPVKEADDKDKITTESKSKKISLIEKAKSTVSKRKEVSKK